MIWKIKRMIQKIRLLFCRLSSEKWLNHMRDQGAKIGKGTVIYSNPIFTQLDTTRPWLIEIGENVQIARGVKILTHDFAWAALKAAYGDVLGSAGKVIIGSNTFIGTGTIILKGTTIGNNTIIGAGSVVHGSFPDNCVLAGNPARVICSLQDYREKVLARQKCEAKVCVVEYYKTFGKLPEESILNEFFWLFTPRTPVECAKYKFRLQQMNTYEMSLNLFMHSSPEFVSYEAFLEWCMKDVNH